MQEKILSKEEAKNLNAINLAFIGDAVYSLLIRKRFLLEKELKAGELNSLTASVVRAEAQSELVEKLLPIFTEEEADIFRRARNIKKGTRPKHAKVSEYNNSTGFEAVIGYLYLIGDYDRIGFLVGEKNED